MGVHLDDRLPGQWHGGQFGERLDRHRDHDDVTGRRGLTASDESHSRHVLSVPPEEPNPCHLPDSLRFGSLPSAGGEVMAVVQIGEQAGLSGFPAEGPAGDEAGRRVALRDYVREEPEVSRHHQYVRGNTHGGQAQTAANGLGDLAERDGPVPDRVPVFAGRPFSNAKRNKEATSRTCTAFHRFAPSPG